MGRKETIEDRVKALKAKEDKIKLQLSNDSDEIQHKAKRAGKIALIAGIVAISSYWIYTMLFNDESEQEKKSSKKSQKSMLNRIITLASPYVSKLIDDALKVESSKEDTN